MKESDFIDRVKKKPELKGLPEESILVLLHKHLKKYNRKLSEMSEKEIKELVSQIRAELRKLVGRFKPIKSRSGKSNDFINSHASTRERSEFMPSFINLLRKMNPRTVLDLGCGVHPLAFATPDMTYYAYDLDGQSIQIVSDFFKEEKIDGHVYHKDVKSVSEFPHVDLALLLKIVDVLDTRGHKQAEHVIDKIHARQLVISFSTRTLSGKSMNHPQRGWIERLLARKGYTFDHIIFPNEIVYIAKKL